MTTCNRLGAQLRLALVIIVGSALLDSPLRCRAQARAQESEQASGRSEEDKQDVDDADHDEDQDRGEDQKRRAEKAKRAIDVLFRAGVGVFVERWDVDDEDEEDQNDASVAKVSITLKNSAGPGDVSGFRDQSTVEAFRDLVRSIPNVCRVNLHGTNVCDEQLESLRGLAPLPVLEFLELGDTGITDAGLASLSGLTELSVLNLDGTNITDAGLKNLKTMHALSWLRLGRTNISDAGLAHLRDLPLEYLGLDGTRITDAALVHFKEGMTALYQLNLFDTKVTKAGVDQLRRDVPRLLGRKGRDGATHGGVFTGHTMANNPKTVEPATLAQVARLKQVMWWLAPDSRSISVAHGPRAFFLDPRESDFDAQSTHSKFQRWLRPGLYLSDAESALLVQVPVALVVQARRTGWVGCDVVVFDRPLGEQGEAFMASIAARAAKVEQSGGAKVFQIKHDVLQSHWNVFLARPAPDVLLFSHDREELTKVLARMATKGDRRALDDDLREWKHLDLSARQWAMRHYTNPDSPYVGFIYSLQGGDVARVLYLSRTENELDLARSLWSSHDAKVREIEPRLIEVNLPVEKEQALAKFFWKLFDLLVKEETPTSAGEEP